MKYPTVQSLLDDNALQPHFQPIVRLDRGEVVGHEALIRTPLGECPWPGPDSLFAAARDEGLSLFLEIACVRAALWRWAQTGGRGRLFLNLSAQGLVAAMTQRSLQAVLDLLPTHGVQAGAVVIELTEHERVQDVDALAVAVQRLRRRGIALALDDFGDGRSSLRLWSELKPEIVKIDKYFVRDLPKHADKLQTLRALLQISVTLGAEVVAEGIETLDELRIVRDLGLSLGQGWLFGRPAPGPATGVPTPVLQVLRAAEVAVLPQRPRAGNNGLTAAALLVEAPPLPQSATMEQLFAHFQAHREAPGVALLDADARVQALFPRERFAGLYAQPYFREVHRRRPARAHAVSQPLVLDVHSGIDSLTAVLTRADQRYLTEGFVLVEGGRYRGLGRSEELVRLVTEARIEAARRANPLTLLPGNLPVSEHMRRLLDRGVPFTAGHADLNHFKPFNDHYGYWRGDEMIRLLAGIALAHVDPQRDFVGHVGGDDFVLLFQSEDWRGRCERIVQQFDRRARALFDEAALRAGGIEAEDRHGQVRLHPLCTLSIGAVPVPPGRFEEPEEVAAAASVAKRLAKKGRVGVYVNDVPVIAGLG
jgi:diguanylate cyclase (GGDEF)-like protein